MDEAPRSAVGRASLLSLAFGVFFFDYDLDGYPDILAANGHIEEEIEQRAAEGDLQAAAAPVPQPRAEQVRRRDRLGRSAVQPPDCRARRGVRRLSIATATSTCSSPTNHGPAYLYRNDGGNRNNFICIRTRGVKSNRDGIGAVVRIESAGGKQWNTVHSGSSYCSQSDLALTFGLGKDPTVSAIEVEWPSGQKDRITNVAANQFLIVEEGKGIVSKAAPVKGTHP